MVHARKVVPVQGDYTCYPKQIYCCGDKSMTHRAVLFSAMASGRSVIFNGLLSADCFSTLHCIKELGISYEVLSNCGGEGERSFESTIVLDSPGCEHFCLEALQFDCGNSGTTVRLLIGLVAGCQGVNGMFYGDRSLSSRPMARVVDPLRLMGAEISYLEREGYLPLRVIGTKLSPTQISLKWASAQVKSSIILASLNIDGDVTIELPAGTRNHTENILRRMGAVCQSQTVQAQEKIHIYGPFRPIAQEYKIPIDPSAVAFFAVLVLLLQEGLVVQFPFVLDNDRRTYFLRILQRMGARLSVQSENGGGCQCGCASQGQNDFIEPVMTLEVLGGGRLRATQIEEHEVPAVIDELPILAVAAMFAQGESSFRGLAELRVKESDRLMKTCELINCAGGKAEVVGDDLIIKGSLVERKKPFVFDPAGDHRLAMAAAVAAKLSQAGGIILGEDCTQVSFPGFFEILEIFE